MTKIDSQQNSEEPHLHPKAAAEILAALDRVDGEDQDSNDLPRIDGFQIAQRIASGGGGTVYLAFREQSDQPLAIKVMHPRLGKTNASKRAWRELDFLREIRHASIPRLLDHGESDGHIYLVTEFIDGTPLDRYCTSHELDLRKRVDLLARAADIVQSLHEHGVIHRDIKPGNILIDPDENPVLIDLGIATLFDIRDLETLTLVGEPIGSPVCMSPEQARGERESISTRSDVYGLGATGYLLLTGRQALKSPQDPLHLAPRLGQLLDALLNSGDRLLERLSERRSHVATGPIVRHGQREPHLGQRDPEVAETPGKPERLGVLWGVVAIAVRATWRCGQDATFALENMIGNPWITCKGDERDRYGRLIAVCYAGPININVQMVTDGWALAYRKYSKDYVRAETFAKSRREGMWRTEFMPPWKWRRK